MTQTTVFLDPITHHFEKDRLFDQHPYGDYHAPFLHVKRTLEARGFRVHTADHLLASPRTLERHVYFALGNVTNYKAVAARGDTILSGLFHFEAPIIHPTTYRETPAASRVFRRVYSFSTPEALAPFGCGEMRFHKFMIPEPYDGIEDGFEALWQRRDRKFLCMISQNKLPNLYLNELYTERLRLLEHFSRSGSIDLYGIGWDKMPFRVGERRLPQRAVRVQRYVWERLSFTNNHPTHEKLIRRVWRGAVASKYETMSGYTFAVTYENMELDGWINEKIFDAFLSGTVPIFRGAPDVTDYIPEDCFIDPRRFATYESLEAYLRSLGPREIDAYRENARDFLASEGYLPFMKQTFADTIVRAVEEDLELPR
jgi:hypothetical protein